MFKLTQAITSFAEIDQIQLREKNVFDNSIRNLTQKVHFEAASRDGRADLYSLSTICAIRLVHKAAVFGLSRHVLEDFTHFLLSIPEGPGQTDENGWKLSIADEALKRALEGEEFTITLAMFPNGRIQRQANWHIESTTDPDALDLIAAANAGRSERPELIEDLVVTIPASRLIQEVTVALDGAAS